MNFDSAQDLVEHSSELFSLPDIYFQVNQMLRDQHCSISEIGEVISHDPALSGRLLRVVNSPFYGFQSRIDTISRAIAVVGIDDLYNMVIATCVIDRFSRVPIELINMTDFWMNSIHCGIVTKLLAKNSAVLHSERLFLIGLLHDLGSLLIYQQLPDLAKQILISIDNDRTLLPELENARLGFNHADVSQALLKSWFLPESLHQVIGQHCNPHLAQTYKLDTYLLNLATRLVNAQNHGEPLEDMVADLDESILSFIRISREQLIGIMEQAKSDFLQVYEFFGPTANPAQTPIH